MLLTVSLHWVPRARQRLAMQARFEKKVLEAPAMKKTKTKCRVGMHEDAENPRIFLII